MSEDKYEGPWKGRRGREEEVEKALARSNEELLVDVEKDIKYIEEGHMLSQRQMYLELISIRKKLLV